MSITAYGYGIQKYIIDDANDITNLPKECAPGSTAFCIATSEVYMRNSAGEWVKVSITWNV